MRRTDSRCSLLRRFHHLRILSLTYMLYNMYVCLLPPPLSCFSRSERRALELYGAHDCCHFSVFSTMVTSMCLP